jgi:hypothetical protein
MTLRGYAAIRRSSHRAITGFAASASQMGRFETKCLSRQENPAALPIYPASGSGASRSIDRQLRSPFSRGEGYRPCSSRPDAHGYI